MPLTHCLPMSDMMKRIFYTFPKNEPCQDPQHVRNTLLAWPLLCVKFLVIGLFSDLQEIQLGSLPVQQHLCNRRIHHTFGSWSHVIYHIGTGYMQVICCHRPHMKTVVLYRSAKDTGQLTHNVLYSSVNPPKLLLHQHVALLPLGLLLSALSS